MDPGFHAVDFEFQVLDSSIFQWNLHSGFQSFNGIDREQKPQDMRTRALATVSCIPAFRFSKWRRTNQNLTRHCGRCQAAVLALRIFQHR